MSENKTIKLFLRSDNKTESFLNAPKFLIKMVALRKYLRNPMVQEVTSMSGFYRSIKDEKIKRIDIILEDAVILDSQEQARSKLDVTETRTTYEALMPYRRKIRFIKNNNGMSQLEAIAYTGRRVEWLGNRLKGTPLEGTPIAFKNSDGNDIANVYKIMLTLANRVI